MKTICATVAVCMAAMCHGVQYVTLSPVTGVGVWPAEGACQWYLSMDETTSTEVNLSNVYICKYYYNYGELTAWSWVSPYNTDATSIIVPHYVSGYDAYGVHREYWIKSVCFPATSGWSPFRNMTSITLGEGIEEFENVFYDCDNLTGVHLPSSLKRIGYYSFAGCDGLHTVSVPNSVREIGQQAFYNCTNLVEVNMPTSLISIGDNAFYNTKLAGLSIGDACESIGKYVFYNCTNLRSVSLGGVRQIGDYAFQNCTALETVEIPSSVEKIGSGAFMNCTGLRHVVFNEGLKEISSSAFYGCTNLEEVVLPEGVEIVGAYAFYNCTGAEKVYIPVSVTNVAYSAVSSLQPKDLTTGAMWSVSYSGLTNLVLLSGSTAIGNNAFSSCKSLERIELPNTIGSIGSNAFNGCTNLAEIVIPDSVEVVDSSAFYNCSRLKALPLLNGSVTNWGNSVFYGCSSVDKVTVPGNMISIPASMFANCTNLKEVVIGEGVESINYNSFYNDNAVEFLTLPSTATNINYNGTIVNASKLKVANFNQLHPPKYVERAFLNNFTGTAYYPPDYADEWQAALGTLTAYCKAWTEIDENDAGSVAVEGVEIPYSWIGKYHLTAGGSNPSSAATAYTGKKDSNGRMLTALDDFIAGTDPTDPDSRFAAKIDISDGRLVIAWEPDLNTNGTVRTYTLYGKESLDGEWTSPTNSTHRFFKVDVSMP